MAVGSRVPIPYHLGYPTDQRHSRDANTCEYHSILDLQLLLLSYLLHRRSSLP